MKWSNGEPFTADDIVFAVEEVLKNSDLTPVTPAYYVSGPDEPATATKIDETTVVITFPRTHGLFHTPRLAATRG